MRQVGALRIMAICSLGLVLAVLAGCGLLTSHTVSPPDAPSGPSSGETGESLTYSTGGSGCSRGHAVEYRFDWGDGTHSSWTPAESATTTWESTDTYQVRAAARCATNTSVLSNWSSPKTVSITVPAYGEIGDTRDNGRLAITLRGVRTADAIGPAKAGPGCVFLIVDIKGVALQDVVHLVAESFVVVQADGQEHPRSGATVALDHRLDTRTNMYTGQWADGELAFEVVAGQEHYSLEYTWGEPIRFRFAP